MILDRFKQLVNDYYTEPTDEEILGSFLAIILRMNHAISKKKEKRSNPEINVPDIREMFRRQAENGERNERKDNNNVIAIDQPLYYRKNVSKRYTLPFLFNCSSSDSFCQLGDYYLKRNNFQGN